MSPVARRTINNGYEVPKFHGPNVAFWLKWRAIVAAADPIPHPCAMIRRFKNLGFKAAPLRRRLSSAQFYPMLRCGHMMADRGDLWLWSVALRSRHLVGRDAALPRTEYDAADVKQCITCFHHCVSRIAALESESVPS